MIIVLTHAITVIKLEIVINKLLFPILSIASPKKGAIPAEMKYGKLHSPIAVFSGTKKMLYNIGAPFCV